MTQVCEHHQTLFSRANKVIPGGVNSPIRAWKQVETMPFVPIKGEGDTITDLQGNTYIDYCMSFGALILGHAPQKPLQAAFAAMQNGSTYGLTTEIEVLIAEEIAKRTFCDQVRFVSSGTEALSTMIRLARGFTQKNLIVKFDGNYHGHIDALLEDAGSYAEEIKTGKGSSGVTVSSVRDTISLPYNDEAAVSALFSRPDIASNIALVLLEPVAGNMGVVPASRRFLELLREKTEAVGALLGFDEVISGFRVHPEGACGLYQIDPDLVAYGKIVGGGFPAACIGGRKEIMESLAPLGNVFQAGTLSGNPVALAAGFAALQELQENVYQELARKTALLLDPIEKALEKTPHSLQKVGSMFSFFFYEKAPQTRPQFSPESRALFQKLFRMLLKEGVYFAPAITEAQFISAAHTDEHLLKTREILLRFFRDQS